MRPHKKISEQLVSVVSGRGVEPLLGATGPRDELVAILQIAVLDHFFPVQTPRWLGAGHQKVATGRVDNGAGDAFGRHPLAMDALAQLRPRRSGAS